ncbi:unnamed protein product [Schistosoma turkestanicum]|nr:unnamed protein product [Schistosoma turkestanicum]
MGKKEAKRNEYVTFENGLNNYTVETGKAPKISKKGTNEQNNELRTINYNDKSTPLSSNKNKHKDEAVVVKESKNDKQLKRKHSLTSNIQSDNALLEGIESKSETGRESVSELPSKKRKHNSKSPAQNECGLNDKIVCHAVDTNIKETALKHRKQSQQQCSVLNVHSKGASGDQKTPKKPKKIKPKENGAVDKSKRKKRKRENGPSLNTQSQNISFDQTVSNTTDVSKLQDSITVSYNSSKPKKCKQNTLPKIEKGKWYHEYQISSDKEYLTSDESSTEVDNSQSRSLQRQHRRLSNERLSRTIFVGNLPLNITKKRIEALFNNVLRDNKISSSDCSVESVRFRGAIPVTGGTSRLARKRAAITGEFSGVSKFRMGYVVLTTKIGIPMVLSLNGCCLNSDGFIVNPEESIDVIDNKTESTTNTVAATNSDTNSVYHIRVDKATDNNKTRGKSDNFVFIGNLPFDCTEEEIYSTLSTLGSIKNVRLIRDSQTGAVRGFGYVTFNDPSVIPLAIRSSNTLSVRGRQIRIMEYKVKKTQNKNVHQQLKSHNNRNKISNTNPKQKKKHEKRKTKLQQEQEQQKQR